MNGQQAFLTFHSKLTQVALRPQLLIVLTQRGQTELNFPREPNISENEIALHLAKFLNNVAPRAQQSTSVNTSDLISPSKQPRFLVSDQCPHLVIKIIAINRAKVDLVKRSTPPTQYNFATILTGANPCHGDDLMRTSSSAKSAINLIKTEKTVYQRCGVSECALMSSFFPPMWPRELMIHLRALSVKRCPRDGCWILFLLI